MRSVSARERACDGVLRAAQAIPVELRGQGWEGEGALTYNNDGASWIIALSTTEAECAWW